MSRLALLLLAVVLALPATAGAVTVFDKPVPERKIERLHLSVGGFVQPRFTFTQEDPDAGSEGELGFEVRRVRLEIQGGLDVPLAGKPFNLEIDHKMSVELMPEPRLQDGWFEVGLGDFLRLRMGQQKTPTSRSLLVSDKNTMFPERAHIDTLSPRRDMGVQLHGEIGEGKFVEYGVGVFNGEGRNRLSNVNRKFLYAARLAVSPLGSPGTEKEVLSPKDGWRCNKEPDKHAFTFTLGYAWHFNQIGPPGAEEAFMGHNVELFAHYRWVNLQSEFLYVVTDFEDKTLVDFNTYGWYVQLALFPPMVPWVQDHFAFLFRVEEYDEFIQTFHSEDDPPIALAGPTDPAQKQRNVSFGLTFYSGSPLFLGIGDLRIQALYTVRTEAENQPYRNDLFQLAAHLTI